MRNFYVLLAFTIVSLALAVLFFLDPGVIGQIPYGTFTFGFATLICFWVASRLSRTNQEATDDAIALVATLRNYFLVMGVFFFFDGIAHVGIPALYPVPVFASYMHTFAHIFFFIGNAIIIRIPVAFINPRWKNAASWSQIVLGVLAVGWRLTHLDTLVTIAPGLPPIVVVDQVSDTFFLVANGLALLLPGLYVVYRGFRALDHATQVRAVLLGLGMMIFFAIGPVIDYIQGPSVQLLIHLLQASSFGLMGLAALYAPQRDELVAAGRVTPAA
jgi:hypothetical protein